MNPIISINVPCYNRSQMLGECVDSFISQTFTNWELIVADDGSEEDISFVKDMDSRVKYVRQEHLGMAKAYNLALENSIGEYIMPMGSDDLATPRLLEDTLGLMEKYKNRYDVIYQNRWVQTSSGKLHRSLSYKTLNSKDAYQKLLTQQYIPHGGTLWKKEKMPRYDESLESAVDWELMLMAMENGVRFKHLRTKLWVHRMGHAREEGTKRQTKCCDKILRRRGYYFDPITRRGIKL
jgi:glycosyltransferase involved in cell wall biosynthesis